MASEISDGGATPHATDYSDLLDKLITFAVSTGDWIVVSDQLAANGTIYLKGLDYSGDKNIYVAIRKYANVGTDIYGWALQGYTGYLNSGFEFNPGAITGNPPGISLWNDETPYWFFVNPRRIIMVAKISGVYMALYIGLMLPYGTAGQWAYPLVIGGSTICTSVAGAVNRYSDTTNSMAVPFIPSTNGNLLVRTSTGIWIEIYSVNQLYAIPGGSVAAIRGVSPYCDKFINNAQGVNAGWRNLRPDFDGNYAVKPLRLLRGDTPDALGILDGAFFVAGYNLSTEDTIDIGADTYIVFQDTFRTDLYNFFAIKDE